MPASLVPSPMSALVLQWGRTEFLLDACELEDKKVRCFTQSIGLTCVENGAITQVILGKPQGIVNNVAQDEPAEILVSD